MATYGKFFIRTATMEKKFLSRGILGARYVENRATRKSIQKTPHQQSARLLDMGRNATKPPETNTKEQEKIKRIT